VAVTYVSDEVWQQLPKRRLPRGRVVATLLVFVALGVLLGVLQTSGLFTPHFSAMSSGSTTEQGSHHFTEDLLITNSGYLNTTVRGVSLTAPWLHVTEVSVDPLNTTGQRLAGNNVTLGPSQSVTYRVEVSVPDCAAIANSGSAVAIAADGPLRTSTVTFQPQGTDNPNAPAVQTWTGPTNPYLIPWPVAEATLACKPANAK